jgi:DNA-binding response OmpR family regulator
MTFEIFESRPAEGANAGVISALLVEDDKHLVEEESRNILLVFPRLKVAGDAVEAAKLFRTEKFSVAFVDLSLPSINGRELCGQLKKANPDCTTVLLTNREGEEKSEGVDYISLRPLESDTITRFRPM